MDFDRWKTLITSAESADRSEAADLLPEAGPMNEVKELLFRALNDDDALVRTCAADTVGEIRSDDVRSRILQRLEIEHDDLTRSKLLSSLGAMECIRDIPLLTSEIETADSPGVRVHAAYGLLLSCAEHALSVIQTECDIADWKRRTAAFSALANCVDILRDGISQAKEAAVRCRSTSGGKTSGMAEEAIERILSS